MLSELLFNIFPLVVTMRSVVSSHSLVAFLTLFLFDLLYLYLGTVFKH